MASCPRTKSSRKEPIRSRLQEAAACLKEALDAAHGHAHAADGSELSDDAKKDGAAAPGGDGHGHGDEDHEEQSPFWMIVSGVLFVLLLVVGFRRNPRATPASEVNPPAQPKGH